MKIKKVEIQAFRAYKTKEDGTFDFNLSNNEPSNFVGIYAPNGFGKSSFYDAVEWGITNNVERISGEHNKKIIETAARCTKQEGVGQKILRNKDVNKKLSTFVNISSTNQIFNRSLKIPRSDSKDIPRNKKIENQYFSQVILSQDAIDRFLKETKPEDRYLQFMDYFGKDIEAARKKLTILINDNNSILLKLKADEKNLKDNLSKPVDMSILEQFNSIVKELILRGEEIKCIENNFSLDKEYELNSSIIKRINEIFFSLQQVNENKEKLLKIKMDIPFIKNNLKLIEEKNPRYHKIKKGYEDSIKYQDLNKLYLRCQEDLKNYLLELEKIYNIEKNIQFYNETKQELQFLDEKKKEISADKAIRIINFNEKKALLKNFTEEIDACKKRIEFLYSKINSSDEVYNNIINLSELVAKKKEDILQKDHLINHNSVLRDKDIVKIKELENLKITPEFVLNFDTSQLLFESQKIEKLKFIFSEISKLDFQEKTIVETQSALTRQLNLQDKLVATGLEIINFSLTDLCPLCHMKHETNQNLKEAIVNNNIISTLISSNFEKISYLSQKKNEYKEEINTIITEVKETRDNLIFNYQKNINFLTETIDIINIERNEINLEIKNIEQQKFSLEESVWFLDKHILVERSEAEINEKRKKSSEIDLQILSIERELNEINNSFVEKDKENQILDNKFFTLISDVRYKSVLDFSSSENVIDIDLLKYCNDLISRIKNEIESKNNESMLCLETLKNIHSQMISEGTWINFSELEVEKNKIEKDFLELNASIKSFNEEISFLIDVPKNISIDSLEIEISNRFLKLDKKLDNLKTLNQKYNLLSEYLKGFEIYRKRVVLENELLVIKKSIEDHELVCKYLANERDAIVDQIKERVNSFFFTDLINAIYKKIDPHPEFKHVDFLLDITLVDKPGLNIVIKNNDGEISSPILYFSTAQMNILSLSVFLANALHAVDDNNNEIDVIMIDDPIQSMDSINILSTIDLIRSIIIRFNKQIIISTHDRNFFELLRRKIPNEVMGAKFIELKKFGVAAPVTDS
ncbi:MAG: hypothetical protein OC189_11830 [Acinetobacter sp.]|uniref:AAA family ATPase n=1 Tax=Acinetobacter sp. TaxID=472 RepID=UPI00258E5637|nr:AAA family ATPase [Acinetobacter sp.]MDK4792706.1 hypothetical protein [Acinetobacter sp.]